MADALDPEDVHALMDGFFALALEAVHDEGGTVNQFRGDGFMALFGAPRARGDDAARALRAALAVRERSREYAESVRARYGVPFSVRIGVSTGLRLGRRDRQRAAPRLHRGGADRRPRRAPRGARRAEPDPGQRGDRAPRRRLRAQRPRRARGARAQRAGARVRAARREAGRRAASARGATRGLSPVRRARARARARCAARCCRVRASAASRCVGEAGIGKSRLVQEALRSLPPASVVLQLACRESSARRAYVPWLHLLRRWPAELPGAERAAQLALALDGRGAAPVEPAEVARALRALLAELLATRSVVDRDRRRALARSVVAPARAAAHRAIRPRARSPWSRRSATTRPATGAPAAPVERLALGALALPDARRLAELASGGLEADLAELACLRGGGNPLFVEEVARALRDGSPGLREAARLELSLARARERIPETLWGVVAARIDALPESAKRVLEMAAVVGERFDAGPGARRRLRAQRRARAADRAAGDARAAAPDPERRVRLLPRRRASRGRGAARARAAHLAPSPHRRRAREASGGGDGRRAPPASAATTTAPAKRSPRSRSCSARAAPTPGCARCSRPWPTCAAPSSCCAPMPAPPPELESPVGLALASALAALDRTGEAAAVLESLDTRARGRRGPAAPRRRARAGRLAALLERERRRARARARRARAARRRRSFPDGGDTRLLGLVLPHAHGAPRRPARAARSPRPAASPSTRVRAATAPASPSLATTSAPCTARRGAPGEARAAAEDALALAGASENDLHRGRCAGRARARAASSRAMPQGALAAAARADELAARSGQVGFRYLALGRAWLRPPPARRRARGARVLRGARPRSAPNGRAPCCIARAERSSSGTSRPPPSWRGAPSRRRAAFARARSLCSVSPRASAPAAATRRTRTSWRRSTLAARSACAPGSPRRRASRPSCAPGAATPRGRLTTPRARPTATPAAACTSTPSWLASSATTARALRENTDGPLDRWT